MRNSEITGVEAKRTQHVRGQAGSPASGRGVQAGKPCSWRRGRVVYGEDLLLTERLCSCSRAACCKRSRRAVFSLCQDRTKEVLLSARPERLLKSWVRPRVSQDTWSGGAWAIYRHLCLNPRPLLRQRTKGNEKHVQRDLLPHKVNSEKGGQKLRKLCLAGC